METPNFLSVLHRYFFFCWLFRDVGRGTVYERAAAWRHNQRHADWLLTYLKRWLFLSVLCFAAGGAVTLAFDEAPWLGAPFYVLVSVSLPVSSVIVVAWLGLRLLPCPDQLDR